MVGGGGGVPGDSTRDCKRKPPTSKETGRLALDVGCWMFGLRLSRRVTGAWWPSRSSKPLSVRFTGRGGFDSYPLRHVNSRFTIYDLRFEKPSRAVVSGGPRVNRRSSIVNPEKGGDGRVANADS